MDGEEENMYKKILFGTCLTDYCDHIFNFALKLAKENDAKLWIYHGLGHLKLNPDKVTEAIKEGETRVAGAYVERMKSQGFSNYAINVSDGNVAREISKIARNAAIDVLVIGTSTQVPIGMGESVDGGPLGKVASEIILSAPCPVLIVPPSMIPGLARG